jgi:hypothetical protein
VGARRIWRVPAAASDRGSFGECEPAGAGRPPVNGGAASDWRSSEITEHMAMQTQMRVLLKTINRLVHEKTAAAAAAARRSAVGEALRGHRRQRPGHQPGHQPGHHNQVRATRSERCRGQRPRPHDQVPATLKERLFVQRLGHHDQLPETNNCRGQPPGHQD